MSWLAWLGLAVVVTALAAVTGIKPKGTRHVAHTSLMGMARLTLVVVALDPRLPCISSTLRQLTRRSIALFTTMSSAGLRLVDRLAPPPRQRFVAGPGGIPGSLEKRASSARTERACPTAISGGTSSDRPDTWRWHFRCFEQSHDTEELMSIRSLTRRMAVAVSCTLALAFANFGAPQPRAIAGGLGEDIKLSGCLVRGEGDGAGYLLTNAPSEPWLKTADTKVMPSAVGTTVNYATVFYWLDGSGDLKQHVGHRVEIEGDLKGDVRDGELKMDRKDNWTE